MSTDLSPFGALLKSFRKRRRLTQQQLAEAIGVHRSAIIRWEQGDFLPESKAMILELARHLSLNEQETRHLLEASLTALAPHWSVPLPHNPFFTGREEILEVLHTQLSDNQVIALTQSSALHGLGGVGKTQIALEYAYRHSLEYSAVFWIGAETEEQIVSSLLRIAEVLQLPGRDDKDQQQAIAAVQRWLSVHDQWLLIWDNVEDLALLDRFLPSVRSGAMLLTTRCQALGTLARGVDLLPMAHEEGMLFLLRRAKVLDPKVTDEQIQQFAMNMPAEYTAAKELMTTLGGLPLALDQAGAYIEETGCSLTDYLCRYKQHPIRLLDRRGGLRGDHPQSVMATVQLAMKQMEREQPTAADILRVCALLHAEAIPEELFVESAVPAYLGPELACLSADLTQFDTAIAALRKLSLVQRQAETHTISLHRLVQMVLKEQLPELTQRTWMRRVLHAISSLFPFDQETQVNYWQNGDRLLPHALACLTWSGQWYEDDPLRIALMNHVATYLRLRNPHAQAESLYLQALGIGERTLGPEHILVAETLDGLAILRQQQMHYGEAESLFRRALHIREQTVGAEHPQVANSLSHLASLYWRQGKYGEAESLRRQVLHIRERTLGAEHPQVAASLSNLATIYHMQGKYAEVEPLFQQALHIRERTFGAEHPQVGESLHNLAAIYLEQGRYEEAEPLFQRALHIWELVLGPEDLDVAYPLNGLAELYRDVGKYEAAEAFFLRALHIREQGLGLEHPRVAELFHGMANLYLKQEKCDQADLFYKQALAIREQRLGPYHPETADTLHDLALLRYKQGNLDAALPLAERALSIRVQSLGDMHPQTVVTQTLSTQLLQEQASAQKEANSEAAAEEMPGLRSAEQCVEREPFPFREAGNPAPFENDHLQAFLDACCELHPLAWCRISDLWQTYEQWTALSQGCIPLSRRAFAAQMKARGCRTARTSTARIWRGITLVNKNL
jgi:tetratricopeptide (TPR) repeat protein